MVASVFVVTRGRRIECPLVRNAHSLSIDLTEGVKNGSFKIEINFDQPIKAFRNHDYRWADMARSRISNAFTPKAIRLENGTYIQPDKTHGIWETNASHPKQLSWLFNPPESAPLGVYHGIRHTRKIGNARVDLPDSVTLLFSKHNAVEFSRSAIPFSAIACFTDHCDFDTAENLVLQRELFKDCGIRVTKGFFLNHYSSRPDNASFENQSDELAKWRADGHELAYHSLAQAAKSDADSFDAFAHFVPPFPDLTTWIDHAYQPYNLSLYANHGKNDAYFAQAMTQKNIRTFWNYIDSGAATTGVINQLNRDDFTLRRSQKGNAALPLKKRFGLLIKNAFLHYYADEKIVAHYMYSAINFKKVFFRGQLRQLWPMLRNMAGMIGPLLRLLFCWNRCKREPFRLARYMPVVFSHRIDKQDFFVFQTIEMSDFASALEPKNIEKLIAESGLFIAHTYFAAPTQYHHGKMFCTPNRLDNHVAAHFKHLGEKIHAAEIWNPTLSELVGFLANFEKTVLATDAEGCIVVASSSGLPYRTIN
jgi:hypothetical protein